MKASAEWRRRGAILTLTCNRLQRAVAYQAHEIGGVENRVVNIRSGK